MSTIWQSRLPSYSSIAATYFLHHLSCMSFIEAKVSLMFIHSQIPGRIGGKNLVKEIDERRNKETRLLLLLMSKTAT